ncbi:MAG: zinc-binding dehydrogenase [Armatimonadota bacterium]|nr:zinc-binding dehydrogenase [Armatimonadota bacterium]
MRAERIIIEEPKKVGFIPEDLPTVGDNQVLVRAIASGISAGTEMSIYRGSSPFFVKNYDEATGLFLKTDKPDITYPFSVSYEHVSEVVEAGKNVSKVKPGDKVFSFHYHATAAVLDEDNVYRIPSELKDPSLAVASALLAVTFQGILDAAINLGETVVIFGMGMIGQLAVRLAKMSGAKRIIAVDLLPHRLQIAETGGATELINPKEVDDVAQEIRKRNDGRAPDVILECSGSYKALYEATRVAGYNGRVVTLSYYQGGGADLFLGEEFHHNRVQIVCSRFLIPNPMINNRWDMPRRMEMVMSLLPKLDLESFITRRIPYKQAAEGYKLVDESPDKVLLVVFEY